jgi:L-ascorbate metabolism protein UlaG (beta-lactamase superfamily)
MSFVIDPVFSKKIAGHIPRYGTAPLQAEQLPKLAAIMVTHNHYDHLDGASLRALPDDVPVVVPLGLARWFERWNARPVIELDWWESARVADLEITLVPARHWSRRWLFDTNRALWGGFVVRAGQYSVYHAGDTGWFVGFKEIGQRFPGLDAAMLPIGAYSPPWFMEKHHMNPEQAGLAFVELGARRLVPMHWGAFQLTAEPISELIGRLEEWWRQEQPPGNSRLCRLAVGETLVLDEGVL